MHQVTRMPQWHVRVHDCQSSGIQLRNSAVSHALCHVYRFICVFCGVLSMQEALASMRGQLAAVRAQLRDSEMKVRAG